MEGILPRSAPKIEHDPNLEAATAHVAINPVTGASAEPLDELTAFAVMFFRTAYPFDGSILSSPAGASKGGGEKDGAGPPTSLGAVSRADNVADVAVVQPRVVPHRAQEAVNSRPQGQVANDSAKHPTKHRPTGGPTGRRGASPPVANLLEASITRAVEHPGSRRCMWLVNACRYRVPMLRYIQSLARCP